MFKSRFSSYFNSFFSSGLSLAIVAGSISLNAQAGMPDIRTDSEFRTQVSRALVEQASSLNYRVDGNKVTFVIGYGHNYHRAQEENSKAFLQTLLATEAQYSLKKTVEDRGNLIQVYSVQAEEVLSPVDFEFTLTALDYEPLEGETSKALEGRKKVQVQVHLMNLMNRYNVESNIINLETRLQSLESQIRAHSQAMLGDPEFLAARYARDLRTEMINYLNAVGSPMKRIEYVRDLPSIPEGVSDKAILEILQERSVVRPACSSCRD